MVADYDYELEARKQQPVTAHTVSLGHNFSPISTMYEPHHKSIHGKTFDESIEMFEMPFLPEEHKFYEIGYSKEFGSKVDYVYLPWERYEERLIQVVGRGRYILETIGSWIDESGKPVLRMRLRVLDVVFEANGYAKPRGDWKGSLTEIAEKDGFKEICERLCGIGAYLKNQSATISYIFENATDEKLKGEMRRLAGQRRLDLPGARAAAQRQTNPVREKANLLDAMDDPNDPSDRRTTAPAKASPRAKIFTDGKTTQAIFPPANNTNQPVTPKQTTEKQVAIAPLPTPLSEVAPQAAKAPSSESEAPSVTDLYPRHSAMVKTARERAGVDHGWLVAYLDKNCNGSRPARMDMTNLNRLFRVIAIKGYYSRFQNHAACGASYDAKIAVLVGDRPDLSHLDAFLVWCNETDRLVEVRQLAAPASNGSIQES